MSDPQSPTPEEVDRLYATGKEMEKSENGTSLSDEGGNGLEDLPGGAALNGLLGIAPFSAYIVHRAKLEYQHRTLEGRVRKYCIDHPWQNKICTVLDLVLRFIIVGVLVIVLCVFLLKALSPLPDIPSLAEGSGPQVVRESL